MVWFLFQVLLMQDGNVLDIQREDNIIYLPVSYTVTAGAFGDGSIKYDSIELPE